MAIKGKIGDKVIVSGKYFGGKKKYKAKITKVGSFWINVKYDKRSKTNPPKELHKGEYKLVKTTKRKKRK